jgi:hypothetical protein
MTSGLMRLLIVVHRYVGVAVGLLMALWCLSGFVMMYQSYPRLSPADRLKGLEPLERPAGAAWTFPKLADDAEVRAFRLETVAGKPVLHLQYGPRRSRTLDLTTGQDLEAITPMRALMVANAYSQRHGLAGSPTDLGVVDVDQWTLDGINRAGPMHRIRFNDAAGTELYVAATTGEAVQMTTRRTRLLAWLGAIPHWLYPTILRNNPPVWDAVVVWASLVGVFLTAIGMSIGIARIGGSKSGRWSPYRGWFYWHHLTGLIFGVLTLTWVTSGLLTMTPWGLLASSAGQAERATLAGSMTGAQVKGFLAAAPRLLDGRTVSIESAPLEGRLYALVKRPGRDDERVDGRRWTIRWNFRNCTRRWDSWAGPRSRLSACRRARTPTTIPASTVLPSCRSTAWSWPTRHRPASMCRL